ncbi:iron ABC transporter permease [Hydrogenophaga sp. 5NK40-0174]|uniref:ABC transporter permease n=1 Tax=Hydrogenophaga sp. 5NK40-0174 TaxID=3127649 RepID=UPI003104F647
MKRVLASPWLIAALPLAFLLAVAIAPAGRLLWEAVASEGSFGSIFWWQDDYLRWRFLWSLAQAGLTCVLSFVLGLPIAWVLARMDFPGRSAALRLLMLPFVMPTLVAAMGVLAIWGARGTPGQWLAEHGMGLGESPWLLIYGNLFFNLCLVIRAGVDGLEHVSATRVAAARSLGASPWRAFWRVDWPAIAPWLSSALCLVFLYCFSGLGLALVLGGHQYATVEVEIYTLVAHELELRQAGILAVSMLFVTGAVALVYAAIERRLAAPGKARPLIRLRPESLAQKLAVVGAMLSLFLVCGAPLLVIAWRAVLAMATGAGLGVLAEPQTWHALGNTLRFTFAAVVLATLLGLLHAAAGHAIDQRRSGSDAAVLGVVWRAAGYLPFVVSSVTVAFGLLLLYPQWSASLLVLLAAYALLAYPFVARSITAGLDSMPRQYVQAARSLGASPWRAWRRVTLPLMLPALRRGVAFAAATALGEFAVTLFLSRPEWTTLTTLIYQRLGRPGEANLDAALVLAFVLMLLALTAFLAIEGTGRSNKRADHAPASTGEGRHA